MTTNAPRDAALARNVARLWMRNGLAWCLAVAAAGWAAAAAAQTAAEKKREFTIGVLVTDSDEPALIAKWTPLAQYLTARVEGKQEFKIVPISAVDAVSEAGLQKIDFLIANAAIYAILESRHQARALATVLADENLNYGMAETASAIIVRADRTDLKDLSDLARQRIAAVDRFSIGGWLAAWQEIRKAGVDSELNFKQTDFLHDDRAVFEQVMAKQSDAGILRAAALSSVIGDRKSNWDEVRILDEKPAIPGSLCRRSTALFPAWPFIALRHVSPELCNRMAAALIAIPADDPAIKAARINGWATPASYFPVHQLVADTLPDFAPTGTETTTSKSGKPSAWWVAAFFVFLLAMFFVSLQIARAKHRAENELSQARDAERKIVDSEERIRLLLDSVGEGVFAVDEEGNTTYVNQAGVRMFGWRSDDLLARSLHDKIHGHLLDSNNYTAENCGFHQAVRRGIAMHINNESFSRKDGGLVPVDCNLRPIRREGKTVGVVCTVRDTTEQKRVERELKEATDSLHAIMENAPAAFIVSGGNIYEKLAYLNPQVTALTGYTADDIVTADDWFQKACINSSERERVRAAWIRELGPGLARGNISYQVLCKDGSIKDMQFWMSTLPDGRLVSIGHDVTELHKVERALRESQERLTLALDGTGLATWDMDIPANRVVFNDTWLRIFGFTADDVGSTIAAFKSAIHPEDRDRAWSELMRHCDKETPVYRCEVRIRTPGGGFKWALALGKAISWDADGRPKQVTGFHVDIDQQKRLQEAVFESEERHRIIFEKSPAGILYCTKEGKITNANAKLVEIFGTSDDRIVRLNALKDMPDEALSEAVARAIAGESSVYQGVFSLVTGTRSRHIRAAFSPITPDAPSDVIGTVEDITEQMQAQASLRASQEQLDAAINGAALGLWDFRPQIGACSLSERAAELLGLPHLAVAIPFEQCMERVHPDDRDRIRGLIESHVRGDIDHVEFECRVLSDSDQGRWVFTIGKVRERDAEGRSVRAVGIFMDIDDRKRLEAEREVMQAELVKAKEAAESANRAKSLFLTNMTHEIRTPMTAILGYTQLLQRDASLGAQQKEYLRTVGRSGENLLALINDILDMSRLEAGRMEMRATPFDFHGMLQDMEDMFRIRAGAKNLSIEFRCEPEVPRYLRGDESKIRQILINMLGNAVKFTSHGGIILRASAAADAPGRVAIEVEDTGCGIPERDLDRIFQPFEQSLQPGRRAEGSGLGMTITRHYARRMGGDVTVKSREGLGSVFRVELALEVCQASDLAAAPVERIVHLPAGETPRRAMLIDDQATNRELLGEILSRAGFEIRAFEDGASAEKAIPDWRPDIILSDEFMPGERGTEVMQHVHATEAGRNIPVIIVSASGRDDVRDAAIAAGASGYLRKPFREDEIFETIRRVMGVEFIYETEAAAAPLESLTPELVGQLPSNLRQAMRDAVANGDMEQFEQLLVKIPPEQQNIARALKPLADEFNYDGLSALLG